MKRLIVLEIDCEDERCGECNGLDLDELSQSCVLSDERTWLEGDERYGSVRTEIIRGPECLKAEAKLRRLVEAGNKMKQRINAWFTPGREPKETTEWDAAIAALEEK